MMIQKFGKRLAALLLAVLLLLPLLVWAEEDTAITHMATANVALKVRRKPDSNASGGDSIPRGSFVYILEYGDMWCKVRTQRLDGYVMTKYLDNIQAQEGYEAPAPTEKPENIETMPGFTTSPEHFHEGYIAHAVVDFAAIYAEPRENTRRVTTVKCYDQVTVSEVSGEWCLVRYKGAYGYMRNDSLFKWDRIDPYVGEIPGLEVWPNLIFVNRTTTIRDINTNEVLQTVNPGAAISAGEKDAMGRYPLPYHRTTGYVSEADVAWVMPVTRWEEAESGDLISVMSTFFAVGKSTLQFQGRNWNIHLASGIISGTVLQPGQEYNMNKTIGPYAKSTGYKTAPIMSQHALSGNGGGTCQVNTTFYIATIQLPLLVTHRKVHAEVGIYYAEKGFDAAVGGGDINLTMKNTMPYAVRYEYMNSDGVLTCCIFRN